MSSDFYNEGQAWSSGSDTLLAEPILELRLLRRVFNSFSTGIVALDRNLRYLMVNEAAAAMNGMTVADHIGRRLQDVVPDVFPLVEFYYREVFRTGKSFRQPPFQAMTPATPAISRWWEVRYHPVFDEEERIVAVTAVFVDASEKVEAESKLAFTLHEMRTVLEVLPVGVAIAHDVECRDVELNDAFKRMVTLPSDTTFKDLTNRTTQNRFILNGTETNFTGLPLRKAASAGEPTEAGRLDIVRPDGHVVNVLSSAAPLIVDGKVQGAVAAYVDITDLVLVQDQLRAANRVQYDFLAMVSHELRTPMTMILGNAQLLGRVNGAFSEDDRRTLATDVYSEAVGLSEIVENLLLMTRIDRGEKLELEPVVLRHICNRVIQDLPHESAARCRCLCPDDLAVVLASPTSIGQVMRNLISNALKYSPETEMVDMTLEVRGNEAVFGVADRGSGIDAGDRERIFEPFFRAESTATRSGMGIGLAVCKRLLDVMGGRIWAESREGGGSIFAFALPKLDAPDS